MSRFLSLPTLFTVGVLLVSPLLGFSQEQTDIKGATAVGMPGITVSLEEIQALSDKKAPSTRLKIKEELPVNRHPKPNPASPAVASYSSEPSTFTDPVLHATQELASNYLAINYNESSSVPPDCMGTVGPSQVCVVTNGRLKFYPKPTVCDAPQTTSTTSGNTPLGSPQFNIDLDVFFASVRNNSETSDPHVHYDRLSARWFIVCINVENTNNRILIAVSNSATITNQSSFTFYSFVHNQGVSSGQADFNSFCDYPMPGVDKDALYIGGLIFSSGGNYVGSSVYVVNKASLLSGGPLTFTAFRRIGTSNSGIYAPQGVINDDPASTRGYFVGANQASYGVLSYVVINTPATVPTASTGTITVSSTSGPIEQVASGSTQKLDGLDDRLLNVQMMKNKITGTSTIWTAQNIAVTAAGVAAESGSGLRNAVRWYELNISGNTLSLKQSGTWFDNAASNPRGYWMGSIAANGQGHALAGASAAGAADKANVIVNGRYNSQALGQLSNTVNVTAYTANYNAETSETQRWGDYTQTVVDPSDNMTIWTFQEFASATNSWGLRATQLKAPPPATPTNMTNITCTGDRILDNVTVTGTSSNFSGFFDPGADAGGPGFQKRLQVASSGNVTISNISFDSPTQIRFTVNYSAATLGSQQTMTITNPDCQSVSFNYTLPTGCVALPVKWLGITAAWVNGEAKVDWKVASELNNQYYEVERSFDGRNFTSIGKVNSGNGITASYSFADAKAGDLNFYRIRQTDKDGAVQYSSVVLLSRQAINKMSIYPNPARDEVRILMPAANGMVRLMDVNGKLVHSVQVSTNFITIPVGHLARGIYMVEYANGNNIEKDKLILQ